MRCDAEFSNLEQSSVLSEFHQGLLEVYLDFGRSDDVLLLTVVSPLMLCTVYDFER